MLRWVKKWFGGHHRHAVRGLRRTMARLTVENLEERSLLTGLVPTAPVNYTPDTPFKLGDYWIDVPANYDASNQTPTELLVWSHGCGGQSKYDIYDYQWTPGHTAYIEIAVDGREGGCWDMSSDPARVLAAIADVKTHFNIDPLRVVLGGYSSGGDLSYRVAFTASTQIAGVLAENTSPFRDTGLTQDQALAAPFRFHVEHLAHTQDTTYPIATVRSETDAVKAAGFPLQRIERPGTHYDANTVKDFQTLLLPYLDAGWTSPGITDPSGSSGPGGTSSPTNTPAPPGAVPRVHYYATGADAGSAPLVNVYNAATGALVVSFNGLPSGFTGGVRVAVGDVNGDGTDDVIVGAGPGGGPQITVYDGKSFQPILSFFGLSPSFTGGVFVGAGDVNGDGFADVVVSADRGGGPQVTVTSGKDGSLLTSFYATVPTFSGGIRVAAGDINGDGLADVIAVAGPGGGPQVTIFDGKSLSVLTAFYALTPTFTGGMYVAAGDVNGDGRADIIVGAEKGGGPQVTVFNGPNQQMLSSFYALTPSFTGGVRVATALTGNGRASLLTAAGPGGGPQVTIFDGFTAQLLSSFFAYPQGFRGGVFVGG